MKNLIQTLVTLVFIHFIWIRCASVATPTGGKKDETPPAIESTIPLNLSKNYKGQIVELIFSETVVVENLKQQLIITPGIEGNYEYELKKNRLGLKFEKPFQSNTTYTLNFRNAVKDITEKNVAENTKLIFSTGDVIDSLFIQGNVRDLLTNKAEAEVLVMLYKTSDTLDIKNSVPYYSTKTDKEGNYLLEYLRSDEYKIYALSEKNNNSKYDNSKEKIAFLEDDISLDSNRTNFDLKIVSIDKEPPRLVRGSSDSEYYNIEFSEGLQHAEISTENLPQELSYQIRQDKNIRIYNTINNLDSIPINIYVRDSAGNSLKEKMNIKFNEAKRTTREKFNVETNPKENEKINQDLTYKINFSKPVTIQHLSKIEFLADTLTPIELDTNKDMKWNNFKTELIVSKKINVNRSLRVKTPEGTFLSVERDTSKAIITTHEIKDASEYGLISGTINTTEPNFIVQLMGTENKVIAEQINTKNYKFQYLPAGKYTIRVVVDKNANGKWDNGDLENRILPEKIIFFETELNLKQNWDLTGNDMSL